MKSRKKWRPGRCWRPLPLRSKRCWRRPRHPTCGTAEALSFTLDALLTTNDPRLTTDMATKRHVFTSESVTEGHPDKVADQISDAVLDEILAHDPAGRVACETLVTTGMAVIAGEATTETDQLMPLPILLAHRLTERLAAVRKGEGVARRLTWLRPDGKSQVSVEYQGDEAVGVKTVVISTQHASEFNGRELKHGTIREAVIEEVVKPVLKAHDLKTDGVKFLINPTGRFVTGGPKGDAGLTGRKIIVDTYGGMARHGGGAFSGKDPS